jgi:hypothetical protein
MTKVYFNGLMLLAAIILYEDEHAHSPLKEELWCPGSRECKLNQYLEKPTLYGYTSLILSSNAYNAAVESLREAGLLRVGKSYSARERATTLLNKLGHWTSWPVMLPFKDHQPVMGQAVYMPDFKIQQALEERII